VIDEHATITRAAETLEQTFAHLAGKRPRAWRQRLLRDCIAVNASLRHHCESTERSDGALGEIEIVIGRLCQLTAAHREHERLMVRAAELLAAANRTGDAPELSTDALALAAQLASAIRDHCRSEIDLIQLRFYLDIGVVD
jgi:hypothetical protein